MHDLMPLAISSHGINLTLQPIAREPDDIGAIHFACRWRDAQVGRFGTLCFFYLNDVLRFKADLSEIAATGNGASEIMAVEENVRVEVKASSGKVQVRVCIEVYEAGCRLDSKFETDPTYLRGEPLDADF